MIEWIKGIFVKKKKDLHHTARFVAYVDAASEWRFKLVGANNETIVGSEGYSSKQNCMKGIDLVKRLARLAPIQEKSRL